MFHTEFAGLGKMEDAGPEQLQPFTGSVEHPNAEASFSPAIPPDQSNAHGIEIPSH